MAFADRNKIRLRISNEEYVFISPASPEHLQRLGGLIDQKMKELIAREPRLSITRAAVMTAMMYLDQAITQEARSLELEQEIDRLRAEHAKLQADLAKSNVRLNNSSGNKKGRR